jgi:adenylate cyclase
MNDFKISLAVIFLFFSFVSFTQTDSLLQLIDSSNDDLEKVNTLIELSKISLSDPEKTISYATDALALAKKYNFKKEEALASKYIGLGYSSQNMYVEATLNWQEAQKIFEEIDDKDGISNILSNLGTIYSNQGDDEKALELYLRSLQIAEEINAKMRTLTVSLNIGLIYQKKSATLDKALEYYFVALELAEELAYPEGIGYTSVNIGEVYFAQNDDSTALAYFQKSRDNLQNSNALPYPMIDIGKVYDRHGDYEQALKIQKEAFDIAQRINSKLYMAQSLLGMANTYFNQNKISEAIEVLQQAEFLSMEIGSKESLKEAYEGLANYSAKLNNYQDAFHFQELLTAINDSLFKSANEKRLNLMMTSFNLEKKEREVEVQELTIQKQRIAKNAFLGGLVLVFIIAFIIFRNYRAKVKINKVLDKQKVEIENLVLNILPATIAKELRLKGTATPRNYESVSVLFTDFKDFTKISAQLTPGELVSELNDYFVAFDNITEKHNLEKIKTIGDAYMCAGGLPVENDTHPVNAIKAALEIQEYMIQKNKVRAAKGEIPWGLRVGINTGPVMAGVVGRKKYAYDIWGSTVNVASRMESNGEVGKVNISAATYELIKDKFDCLYRGKISAKNVGEIDMHFIENEIDEQIKYE